MRAVFITRQGEFTRAVHFGDSLTGQRIKELIFEDYFELQAVLRPIDDVRQKWVHSHLLKAMRIKPKEKPSDT